MPKQITNRPEGRPSKYIPEVIYPKIDEYLNSCGREQTALPTAEGLALYIGVNTDTLYEWQKVHPEFSEYLKKLAETQKNQLMNDGMYGGKEVNASMAIFLLKAIHRLSDGSNQNINISGDKVIAILGGSSVHQDQSNGEDTPTEKKD
jgi:hypothetical protein